MPRGADDEGMPSTPPHRCAAWEEPCVNVSFGPSACLLAPVSVSISACACVRVCLFRLCMSICLFVHLRVSVSESVLVSVSVPACLFVHLCGCGCVYVCACVRVCVVRECASVRLDAHVGMLMCPSGCLSVSLYIMYVHMSARACVPGVELTDIHIRIL